MTVQFKTDEALTEANFFALHETIARLENESRKLRAAIEAHRDHEFPDGDYTALERFEQAMRVNEQLWSVL